MRENTEIETGAALDNVACFKGKNNALVCVILVQ